MKTEIQSKHAVISKAPYALYMGFTDMRNFVQFLPKDKREGITADFDSLRASVQGFEIGVRITDRVPYSKIAFKDDGAPFSFTMSLHFDSAGTPDSTDFHIELSAELNMMMKMMLGSKLKEALDRIADGLADAAEGRMPEGMDFPAGFKA